MSLKKRIEKILISGDTAELTRLLESERGVLNRLIRFLYHPDEKVKCSAARGFGIAARTCDKEKMQILVRQFMWMINDESGTNSWDIPVALGEIGYNNYDLVRDHMPLLRYHQDDPEPIMRDRVRAAVVRIESASSDERT